MVRNALLKDALREIHKTLSRFLAILVIVAIGTAFFVGIKTCGPDMRITADRYFRESDFMDFRLLSTVGFSDDDIAAIRATQGVRGVMPAYQLDTMTTIGAKDRVIRVLSLPDADVTATEDNINRPHLVSGRLPAAPGECAIERNRMFGVDLPLGERIDLRSGDETDLTDSLADTAYTVVGIVDSPLYLAKDRGTTSLGNGSVAAFMLVADSEFKLPYHTAVYVTANVPATAIAYSDEYDQTVAPLADALTATAEQRQPVRQAELRSEVEDTLSEQEAKYETAARQTRSQLANALAQLQRGQAELARGQAEFDSQQQAFTQGIAAGRAKLDAARAQLAGGEQQYEASLNQLQAAGMPRAAAEAQLAPLRAQLDASAAELQRGEQDLLAQEQRGKQELAAAAARLGQAEAPLAAAESEYLAGEARADRELASGKTRLTEARAQLDKLPTVEWYILGRETNAGYMEYQSAAERMDAIATVFPVIFVLVAVLICFTSMSRMVEEQRGFIGAAKALGYGNGPIAAKFLLYGAAAAVIGCLIGLAIGFTLFPSTVFNAYSMLFTLPRFIQIIDWPFALTAFGVSLAVTTVSALLVCYSELRSDAASLLRPRAPRAGRRVWLERITSVWRRLSFTQKVTARNLIRYRSRFFMTVIGVAGCTALLLVGFGLNDAIRAIGTKQFGEIYAYQLNVGLKDDLPTADRAALEDSIAAQPGFAGREELLSRNIDIGFGEQEKSCGLIVPGDSASFPEFIHLRDRVSGQAVPLSDDGVVLSEKLAAKLGVHAGDTIMIKHEDRWQYRVKVTGICENYLSHYVYMSPALYERLYGETPPFNQIAVRLTTPAAEQEQTAGALLTQTGVTGVNLLADNLAKFGDIIRSISIVFVILTVSAAVLSFTVLYTLTTINVNERVREIATIKVLGFHNNEVAGFVLRENLILALIGAAVGLVFGTWLSHFVTGTAEVDMVMFGRQIMPLSYAIAAAMTLAFAGLVNLVMLRPLSKIDMIEALKTVE